MGKNNDMIRHGRITFPESRSEKIGQWWANVLESGKFFPETQADLADKFAPTDELNALPPQDGQIASAGFTDGGTTTAPLKLDEYGEDRWEKNEIKANSVVDFTWHYTATHATRRWNYFITKEGWNPNEPLSRAQFEKEPFFMVQNPQQPHWEYADELTPSVAGTVHKVPMPDRKGYHVILGVWEIANTARAFYQVINVNFV